MEVVVVPAVDSILRHALESVLETVVPRLSGRPGYEDAWRRSALLEGVERGELEPGYALSPRSTRGATRA